MDGGRKCVARGPVCDTCQWNRTVIIGLQL